MCVCVCPYERSKKSFANDGLEKILPPKYAYVIRGVDRHLVLKIYLIEMSNDVY